MIKKYELTNETVEFGKFTLHRIRALHYFGDVKKGDLGGWIMSEANLSHAGNCWIYDDAVACDAALVTGNAKLFNKAAVAGHAVVCGEAQMGQEAAAADNAVICDHATVAGNSAVLGNGVVCDGACLGENASVSREGLLRDYNAVIGSDSVQFGRGGNE